MGGETSVRFLSRESGDDIEEWLADQAVRHPPKSPLGVAIR